MHDVSEPAQGFASAGVSTRLGERLRVGSLTLDVLIVSSVALVLGLVQLGAPSLWVDESLTADEITWPYARSLEGYYWLYYSIEKPWAAFAGYSEWALRFPSVVAAMLSGALMVVLARRLFDRRIALLSGLFLVTSPFVVKWSQQARGYTMLLALSLLATILLLRALERGSRGAFVVYGLTFAAVIVWHPVGGLVLGLPHLVLILQNRERFFPHGLLAAAVVLGLGVPWFAQISMRSAGADTVIAWIPFPTWHTVANAVLDISGAGWFGIVLAAVGLWVLLRAEKRSLATWLLVWAFSPFAVAIIVSIVQHVFLDRYLIAAAPAFALLAAVAVTGVARRLGATLVVVAAAATAVALVQWYSYADSTNWRGEDWLAASRFVTEHSGEDDAVVVVPWWAHAAAAYYGSRVTSASTADSIWVLMWSENGHALPADVRAPLGFGAHRLVEQHRFGWRVRAQLWKRPGTS
jgi:mannosyltransferase